MSIGNRLIGNSLTGNKHRKDDKYNPIFILLMLIFLGFVSFYGIRAIHLERENNSNILDYTESPNEIGSNNEIVENEEFLQEERETSQQETGEDAIVEETITTEDGRKDSESIKAKGIYVTSRAAASEKLDRLIDIAETTEINAMVIDVKDDFGRLTFDMNTQLGNNTGAVLRSISDIEQVISKLKEKDIYVIARIVAFKDPHLAEKRTDLAVKNSDGTLYKDNRGDGWVNPYYKEVWDYLLEVSTQAALAGFDEIQFDYIRFSTGKGMAQVDFGPISKEVSKQDIITQFTKYAYETLKPLGVYVSADVFGAIINSNVDAAIVGQNYVEMAKHLDFICPMIYPSHFGEGNYGVAYPDMEPYTIILKALQASKRKLDEIPEGEHRAIVRPWLQDFTASWLSNYQKYGPKQIRDQINAVYDAGYEEWILWNSNSNYTVEGLLE